MAPGGLVIQKLALQATVNDELLKGLLCMKVRPDWCLPDAKEGIRAANDGDLISFRSASPRMSTAAAQNGRCILVSFHRARPLRPLDGLCLTSYRYLHTTLIHTDVVETSPQYLSSQLPLPLPLSPAHLSNRHLHAACTLLGLAPPPHGHTSSDSPTPSSSRVQVQVETARPEGPVYIAVQGGKRRRPSTGSNGSSGRVSMGIGGSAGATMGGARREYMVVMQVEHDVQRRGNRTAVRLSFGHVA